MWGPREGGRAGAGAAGSARTRLALKPWRPDSGQGGGVRPQAERKPPGPSGRDVGRVPACWGPVGRGWGGPSGRGGLSWGRGRPEAGPRLVLVPAPPSPPRLWREAFGTPSRVSPAPLLPRGAGCSSSSEHPSQYIPPVRLPCSAEQPRRLHCKAVQCLDESVPPSLCVAKISIHAYR